MLVSHDRHLLAASVDRLWLVADGTVTPFDGDLDDYRRRVLSDRDDSREDRPRKVARKDAKDGKGTAERIDKKPLRDRVTRAEAEMARLAREIEKFDAMLADGGLFARDPAKAAATAKSRADFAAALAKAEEDWLAAGTALEAAE